MSLRATQPVHFLLLLAAIFFVRGIAIQGLYPPLEGPDEYQHIAVIQYLLENRALPVYGKSQVPVSLYPDIVANPHPRCSAAQTACIDALPYEQFYSGEPALERQVPIRLYQAQHPPLYYAVMAPLYSWSRSVFGFRPTVYLLRFVNIAAASLAIVLLLYPVLRIPADEALGRLFCLAAAASPMFMLYISRVANDAFALMFAGASMVLALRAPASKRPGVSSALAGAIAGLAVLSKLNGLLALPAVLGCWIVCASVSDISIRRCVRCSAAFLAGYLLVSLPYHLWAWKHYATFLPQQEALIRISTGGGACDWIREIRPDHIWSFFVRHIISNTLWTSGWSFLSLPRPPALVYRVLILAAAGGTLFRLWRRLQRKAAYSVHGQAPLFLCCMLALVTFFAAYVHGLQSLDLYGVVATPSYYVMIGFPAFLACLFAAALGYGRRIAAGMALVMLALFTFVELYGLLVVAAPYWAQTREWPLMLERLALLHPVFPAPVHFFILYPAALVLLIAALIPALHIFRAPTRNDP